ncbi:unnamed protein product [Polarella glacialis]|uniref:DNA (cytosine-5-)-methyltransferase n=1 Tax=Polarella glacialis TaxID=89957 RepID=A0A813D9T4_POLGL|nr:unnamed protein product [Polarella glacialis]
MKAMKVMKVMKAKKVLKAGKRGPALLRSRGSIRAALAELVKGEKGASKAAVKAMNAIPIERRAGFPLVQQRGSGDPRKWKTIEGVQVHVDFTRKPWLPDDWCQGVKRTAGGNTYTVYKPPREMRTFYHQYQCEDYLRRMLTTADGFKGQLRVAAMQREQSQLDSDASLFKLLSSRERAHLPRKDAFHFCIISARRAQDPGGARDIAGVQHAFVSAGVTPTWYVDADSLEAYRALGLQAVVGGKLTPARNRALADARRAGKACVQCSDDISRWDFRVGKAAADSNYNDNNINSNNNNSSHRNNNNNSNNNNHNHNHNHNNINKYNIAWARRRWTGASTDSTRHMPPPRATLSPRWQLRASSWPRCAGCPRESAGLSWAGPTSWVDCSRTWAGEEVSRRHFILGDWMVVDKSDLKFDEALTLKEDYDYCAQHIQKHGSVMRLNRMTFSAKHYSNAGGAVGERDSKGVKEQQNMAILFKKWPNAIFPHRTRKNEVRLAWPAVGKATEARPAAKQKGLLVATKSKVGVKQAVSRAMPPADALIRRTDKVAKTKYIAARCRKVAGKTVFQVLNDPKLNLLRCDAVYLLSDLRYDLQRGYLTLVTKGTKGSAKRRALEKERSSSASSSTGCAWLGASEGDLLRLAASELPSVDILVAGPPCPPWSSMGLREGRKDARADVFWHTIDLIGGLARREGDDALQCFILENVEGILHADAHQQRAIDEVRRRLREVVPDFFVVTLEMNSCKYSLAQNRPRVYVVGVRSSLQLPGRSICKPREHR